MVTHSVSSSSKSLEFFVMVLQVTPRGCLVRSESEEVRK